VPKTVLKLARLFAAGLIIFLILLLALTPNGFWGRSSGSVFTTSSGVQIFYSEAGSHELPPVLLLHGFAVNGDLNWTISGVRSKLSEKYHLIIPDLRGHGRSGKPHDASSYGTQLANDMSELLLHLKIPRATIAGYSLGGFTALKFSQLFPQQTKNVLVMGAGWDEVGHDSLAEKLKPAAVALKANEGVPPLATFLKPEKDPGIFHKYWVLFMTKFLNDPLALAALIEGSEGLTLTTAELASVESIPCVIIGSEDPFFESALKIESILPQTAFKIIQGKNHMSAVSSPEFINYFDECMKM
jgi:pimeloyl-ACP methyl ester carboxylesterase